LCFEFSRFCFNCVVGNEDLVPTKAQVPMKGTLVDSHDQNLSKGFSFVEEHGIGGGLCSSTLQAGTKVQNISVPIPPDKKRHSPRLSAKTNVQPKKVAVTIEEVEDSPSSSDGNLLLFQLFLSFPFLICSYFNVYSSHA